MQFSVTHYIFLILTRMDFVSEWSRKWKERQREKESDKEKWGGKLWCTTIDWNSVEISVKKK